MNPRDVKKIPLTWTPTGVGTVSLSQVIKAADFRDIDITVVGTGTVVVYGSAEKNADDTPPDFTAASTISSAYAPMVIADLGTPNTFAASIAVVGATKIGEVNTNLLTWICVERSESTVDAYITVCDNS